MSILSILGVGNSGLRAASVGLETTGHNVANVATEGFSRRSVNQSTSTPNNRNGLFIGRGVEVDNIERSIDRFLGARLVNATGDGSESQIFYDTLAVAESVFDEGSSGSISSKLSAFYDDLEAMTVDPSDASLRREVVASGQSLSNTVNETGEFLVASIESIDSEIEEYLGTINGMLVEIASYNNGIAGNGSDQLGAGDLLDSRDQLIVELAELTGVTVDYQADGQATVFLGGHALVMESSSRELSIEVVSGIAEIKVETGSSVIDVTSFVGGEIGGLSGAQNEMADWLEQLDTFVETFTDAFNAQHSSGFDATGAAGGDFFTYTAGPPAGDWTRSFAVDESLVEDMDLLAAAGDSTASAGDADNLALLVDLQDSLMFASGTETSEEFMAGLYASVGKTVAVAEIEMESSASQLSDLEMLRDSVSAVDMDEEGVALLQYQAAYEASSKVIQVANQMLDELMDLVR